MENKSTLNQINNLAGEMEKETPTQPQAKVETPAQPQKFEPKDYGNVRLYPNNTGSMTDKNNNWIGKHYALDKVHNIDDEYLKSNLVGKTKTGGDIYKMPDGYFSGNPRVNSFSFKTIDDLNNYEKEYGEFMANPKNSNKNFSDYYVDKLGKEPQKYTPFKLNRQKYPDVETTPYGFIYNVGGKSITDVAGQKKAFGEPVDPNKNYGFTVTNDSGDETFHEDWEKAYNTARGGSEIKIDADIIADNLNKPQPQQQPQYDFDVNDEDAIFGAWEQGKIDETTRDKLNTQRQLKVNDKYITDEDMANELEDWGDYVYSGLNKEQIADLMAKRLRISPEKARTFIDKDDITNGLKQRALEYVGEAYSDTPYDENELLINVVKDLTNKYSTKLGISYDDIYKYITNGLQFDKNATIGQVAEKVKETFEK